jgi:hypothetical protein
VPADDITIRDTFTLAHKLSLKDSPPSDWPALASSNRIAFAGKASDGAAVFTMPEQLDELAQEAEISHSAGVKVRKHRQNTTCFDPDQPGSHF